MTAPLMTAAFASVAARLAYHPETSGARQRAIVGEIFYPACGRRISTSERPHMRRLVLHTFTLYARDAATPPVVPVAMN